MAQIGRPKGTIQNFKVTVALSPELYRALCLVASGKQAETGRPYKWAQALRDELVKSLGMKDANTPYVPQIPE